MKKEQSPVPKEHSPRMFQSLRTLIARWKDGSFSEIIEDWKWILGYSARYKKQIFLYTLLGILSTSLSLISSVTSKYVLDIITGYQTSRLALLAVIMVSTSLSGLVFDSLTNRLAAKLSIHIQNDIQADIFDRIMDADWLSLSRYSYGDILNRFNSDIGTVSGNAISWLPSILISLFRFTATFFVLLYYDWIMAVIALTSAPLLLLLSRYILKKQREYNRKTKEMGSTLMAFEVDSFYNLDTIKSFGTAPFYSRKMRRLQEKFKEICLKHNLFTIETNILMSVISNVVQFVAFGYCLFLLWTHAITFGTMMLFLQQRSSLSTAFNSIVSVIPSFLNSSVSAHRIRELTDLPKELHIPGSDAANALIPQGFSVKMQDVSFSYTENNLVISHSDLQAHPGEIVALVGASGEGKTTLIRLILGLVHPQSGAAWLEGTNGQAFSMNADTRHLFAYVPQGNTLLSGTIAENLRMVKEDASDTELIEALKIACAWEFVKKMPHTIHSDLGERGRGLSEGQAQRIAIARAVLRNAPVLLLDEATSALDVATERRVLKNIIQQSPNKTCIVTTHRPSVLNLCQRVYRVMGTQVTELSEEESSRMAMDF